MIFTLLSQSVLQLVESTCSVVEQDLGFMVNLVRFSPPESSDYMRSGSVLSSSSK